MSDCPSALRLWVIRIAAAAAAPTYDAQKLLPAQRGGFGERVRRLAADAWRNFREARDELAKPR